MTETELLAAVVELLDQRPKGSMTWHHCPDSRHCLGTRGLPDLLITGYAGVIFAELKSDDGETTADQDLWIWMLKSRYHGIRMVTWRPGDLESGRIARELAAIW